MMQEKFRSGQTSSDFYERACPSCGAQQKQLNQGISAEQPAEQRNYQEIRENWQSFFKYSSFFTYARCANCDQLYCPTFFNKFQLVELYNRMSDNTANLPLEVVRKTQAAYYEILKSFKATSGSYLEFGPDIGLLTRECAEYGQFTEMNLIEPNIDVHQQLSESVSKVPHSISNDIDSYQQLPDHSLDVVTMIHVLDHLLDPREVLVALHAKLKRGGKIMIVTHDEASLLARLLKSRWPAFCLQHPQLYRRSTIAVALQNSGFRVIGQKKTYNYFPITYLMKHLFWALRLGNVKLPNLYGLTIPLKLGNIATVAVAE